MNASPLATFRFPENTCIAQASPKMAGAVTLASPGLDVMTDLALVRAATIAPETTLGRAEQEMIQQGVRSLFVVSGFPCVDGLITLSDLVGEKPVRLMNLRHLKRQDLTVADVMTALSGLDALDYDELQRATVEGVVATFQKIGRSHLLVVQGATAQGPARIRGVISLTQIERQLGRALLEVSLPA